MLGISEMILEFYRNQVLSARPEQPLDFVVSRSLVTSQYIAYLLSKYIAGAASAAVSS